MKRENLMQAMNDIDETYLEEADRVRRHRSGYHAEKSQRARGFRRFFYAAAAVIAVSILLPNVSADAAYAMARLPVVGVYFQAVTFRDWDYVDPHHEAHVNVDGVEAVANEDGEIGEQAERSASLTNQQIAEKADALIQEFEKSLEEGGNTSLDMTTSVVTDSDLYYVIRLTAFQAAGDGYEQNWFYVLSKKTGEQVKLADLFRPGSDYTGVISRYLIQTMKETMEKDPNQSYFVGSDMPDADFQSIGPDQQFYINSDGELVISFNEGEVAPMYMGALEFVIPESVIAPIRK